VRGKYLLEKTLHLPQLRQIAAATLLACVTLSAQAQITTGAMTAPRMFHQASTLADGRILVTGGAASPSTAVLSSTEVYDPVAGTFMTMAPMLVAKREHAAVTLKDGRVLVAGGMTPASTFSSFAEVYDPSTGQWTATTPMNTAYFRSMARLLPDGRVMVASRDATGHHAEIFDPANGTFSKSGNMVETTGWHGMVVLADGRVLKVGGYTANAYSRNAEIWDPTTNQWNATGSMSVERQDIQPVLLPDGRVLVAGGRNIMKLNSAEIYDPATGKFSPANDMPMAFSPDSSTVLGDGTIVFTDPYARQLLQYQPASGTWNIAGAKRNAARETSASRLPDGGLLLAGGAAQNDASTYAAVLDQACASKQVVLLANSGTVNADGGSVSFPVTGAAGCRIESANMPAWLKADPASILTIADKGATAAGFTADANMTGTVRNASFYVANEPVTVTQPASATCPWMPYVSPATIKLGYLGGTGTATVNAPANCSWNISYLPGFASITSGQNGTGNGSFTYSVPSNSQSTVSRSGAGQVSALGQTSSFTMTQDGAPQCPTAPSISLSSSSFPAAGGTINATVSAAPTCPWNVSSLPTWVKLASAGSGTGNGSFAISANANQGYALNGSGQVSGPGVASTFNLSQAAGPCANWSASPTSITVGAAGANGSFTLNANPGCSWNLAGAPGWLTFTSASSGSGSATISYSVAPNAGASRNALLSLSGTGPTLSLNVKQDGATAQACTAPINSGTPVNGSLQSSGCPVGARGTGYYTDRYTFNSEPGRLVTITLSSTAFDTYVYLRNPQGTVIKSDDDSGGGTNSRISFALPAGTAGTYTIEATSYASGRTGAYTVSLTQ